MAEMNPKKKVMIVDRNGKPAEILKTEYDAQLEKEKRVKGYKASKLYKPGAKTS